MDRQVNLSLSSFLRCSPEEALQAALAGVDFPVLGRLSCAVAQICPQNHGRLTAERVTALRAENPGVSFRIHANVQVLERRVLQDVADFDPAAPYWRSLKSVNDALGAPAYTAHAGLRKTCSMKAMIDKVRALEDFLEAPVGVEGHYPAKGNPFLMNGWQEWAQVLESGVRFVVDVSHAAIIAHWTHCRADSLLKEMLASDRCLEVHLSGNNGVADQHSDVSGGEWWWPLLPEAHRDAVFFYEGVVSAREVLAGA